MLSLLLFFAIGAVLGLIGLRLLRIWEASVPVERPDPLHRHHS